MNSPSSITAIATVALVIVTSIYANFTYKIIVQSQKEYNIAFIERKLEKLYYPLKFSLETIQFLENEDETHKNDKLNDFVTHYNQIIPYLYLASENEKLKNDLEEFTSLLRRTNYFRTCAQPDTCRILDENQFNQHKQEFSRLRDDIHSHVENDIKIMREGLKNMLS